MRAPAGFSELVAAVSGSLNAEDAVTERMTTRRQPFAHCRTVRRSVTIYVYRLTSTSYVSVNRVPYRIAYRLGIRIPYRFAYLT